MEDDIASIFDWLKSNDNRVEIQEQEKYRQDPCKKYPNKCWKR